MCKKLAVVGNNDAWECEPNVCNLTTSKDVTRRTSHLDICHFLVWTSRRVCGLYGRMFEKIFAVRSNTFFIITAPLHKQAFYYFVLETNSEVCSKPNILLTSYKLYRHVTRKKIICFNMNSSLSERLQTTTTTISLSDDKYEVWKHSYSWYTY